jgi:hypothetical protein
MGKVDAVVMVDLDLTGKDLLEQRLNVAVPVRPMRVNVSAPSYAKHEKNETPDEKPQPRLW